MADGTTVPAFSDTIRRNISPQCSRITSDLIRWPSSGCRYGCRCDAGKLTLGEVAQPRALIGIGGHLTVPPLPHHRAYGSRTRRFDWVKLGQEHEVGGDRASQSSGCAVLAERPGVLTCARTPSVNR